MASEIDVENVVVDAQRLEEFVVTVFTTLGLTESNARDAADVLVKSDIYGIESHGMPRLQGFVNRLKSGSVQANPEVVVVHELPSTALVDGANGLGMVVGKRAMEVAMVIPGGSGTGAARDASREIHRASACRVSSSAPSRTRLPAAPWRLLVLPGRLRSSSHRRDPSKSDRRVGLQIRFWSSSFPLFGVRFLSARYRTF